MPGVWVRGPRHFRVGCALGVALKILQRETLQSASKKSISQRVYGFRANFCFLQEQLKGKILASRPPRFRCNRPKFQDRDFLKRFCFTFRKSNSIEKVKFNGDFFKFTPSESYGLVFAGVGMIPPKTERARER